MEANVTPRPAIDNATQLVEHALDAAVEAIRWHGADEAPLLHVLRAIMHLDGTPAEDLLAARLAAFDGAEATEEPLGCECEQDWNCALHADRAGTWIETRYDTSDEPEWAR
jgi:hypothetical protein